MKRILTIIACLSLLIIPLLVFIFNNDVRVINSVLNYKKAQNENNTIKIIRTISLLDALFAILNLQNTLVVTFGQIEEMIILISISSFLIALLMIIISFKNLINNIKK